MTEFKTKEDLVSAWVADRAHEYSEPRHEDNVSLARIESKMVAKYTPHLYRGGYVIPGYGYSTERIGKYVAADNAGNPELV